MTREEFQMMVAAYLGCTPVFVKTGTIPSFSGWIMVSDGYYDITPEQEARARALSDQLECALYTIYRYANGNAAPHPIMMHIVEREISKLLVKT